MENSSSFRDRMSDGLFYDPATLEGYENQPMIMSE